MSHFAGATSTCELDYALWHRRFAHLNHEDVRKLHSRELVKGLVLKSKTLPDPICEPCIAGKQHRSNVSRHALHRSDEPLQLVHSDVHGPLPVQSKEGYKYWITFIDDHSRFWVVLPLRAKSDAFAAFKQFKAFAENQLKRTIKALRDDKGGEYMSREMEQYCSNAGIHHQHTVRAEPHQNGVAERANRTIGEGITTMLNEACLPSSFWWVAVAAFTHVHNRSPTAALKSGTPYEHWHKAKPDVLHFRVFGCTAYVHVKKDQRKQLQSHTQKCVFIGYPSNYKGWLFWNATTRKEIISDSTEFDERFFPGNSRTPVALKVPSETRDPAEQGGVEIELDSDDDSDSSVLPHPPAQNAPPVLPANPTPQAPPPGHSDHSSVPSSPQVKTEPPLTPPAAPASTAKRV